ncbi:hypothetical protein GS429_13885 [Natronorubrum sp. JWXQ-INN-674]|uniref:Uncharacterized protein n=1 Tax=Natronorubrum halalkaliphilum TaxID=2691917 RepID=A0A6B0VRL4_9EURY|nr:hypothetical protein [Natronorubrum halalkaliphilum]MXV63139.1 hypothetical protein [Natronorubrum halalkaliphilum]
MEGTDGIEGVTRRRALLSAGSIGSIALAGCLDGGRTDQETANGNGDDERTDGDVAYDVFQLGSSSSRPAWADGDGSVPGFVALFESERALSWLIDDADAVEGLEEWLSETDFDESVIVFVESVGPNTCYSEVSVSDVAISAAAVVDGDEETAAITGTAEAADTSDGTAVCGDAVTYPSAFVRVTGDDLPGEAAFRITDGWGDTDEVDTTGGAVDPETIPGYVRPSHDPRTIPDALECESDEFERHWSPDDDVEWGEVTDDGEPTLAMRLENPQYDGDDEDQALEFERGEEVRISMQNVSSGPVDTGNSNKYGLEVLTDDGWMDVRGTGDGTPVGYTDEAVVHSPGEGFDWTFELTEDGVLEGHAHEEWLEVCPELPAGRYRFVFWGVIGDESLAVAFDYTG